MVIMLVGNKSDLESRRNVTAEEGRRFAKENKLLFIEASARTADQVEETFTAVTTDILKEIDNGTIDITSETSGVRMGPNSLGLANTHNKTGKTSKTCSCG